MSSTPGRRNTDPDDRYEHAESDQDGRRRGVFNRDRNDRDDPSDRDDRRIGHERDVRRDDAYDRDVRRDHDYDRDVRRDDRAGHVVDPSRPITDVAAQKAEYGGVKPGAAFFGWLTATGMTVVLTALLAAAGAALGIATGTDVDQAASDATENATGVGTAGIVGLGLILLLAYFCGGYVAGRMARFSGPAQGVAVWVWALVIAGLLALLAVLAGNEYNVLQDINVFPRIPVDEGTLSTAGIIALVVALVASLVGAILGAITGVRYHRKVDRAGMVV
ncbi:hypothetical protein ACOCJ4_09630 [Knoellia sp. CPCC 206435]|uniref:hypothetical protein n=1 Tax=Knoellia terrae TaxID=3404797 RepID=UPI003B42CFF4